MGRGAGLTAAQGESVSCGQLVRERSCLSENPRASALGSVAEAGEPPGPVILPDAPVGVEDRTHLDGSGEDSGHRLGYAHRPVRSFALDGDLADHLDATGNVGDFQ